MPEEGSPLTPSIHPFEEDRCRMEPEVLQAPAVEGHSVVSEMPVQLYAKDFPKIDQFIPVSVRPAPVPDY